MIEQRGGEIVNSQSDGHHTSTQMGSVRYPKKKALAKQVTSGTLIWSIPQTTLRHL